jgi:hypothetical protein
MRRAVTALGGSVLLHACLVWLAPPGLVRTIDDDGLATRAIAFELVARPTESITPIDRDDRKTRVGIELMRPTGRPDDHAPGLAGSSPWPRGVGAHARGEEADERITADDARAVATALGDLLDGMPAPIPRAGTRDEAVLGVTGTGSLVSPGTRGLDMIGVGRGSGPSGDVPGSVGGGALGLGSLGSARERAWIGSSSRSGLGRSMCILRGCRPDRRLRPRVIVDVRIEAGPLDRRAARRAVMRSFSSIERCFEGGLPRATARLVVSPNGEPLASAVTDPCVARVLRRIVFPPASAPSRLAIDLERRP